MNHERLCPHNASRNYIFKTSKENGYIAWNKGLTKETDSRVAKNSKSVSDVMLKKKLDGILKHYPMREEFRLKLSIEQSLNNRGGKCKWFEYKGYKLQGTWELNIAKKLDELNVF